jgi:hypothetical protein
MVEVDPEHQDIALGNMIDYNEPATVEKPKQKPTKIHNNNNNNNDDLSTNKKR